MSFLLSDPPRTQSFSKVNLYLKLRTEASYMETWMCNVDDSSQTLRVICGVYYRIRAGLIVNSPPPPPPSSSSSSRVLSSLRRGSASPPAASLPVPPRPPSSPGPTVPAEAVRVRGVSTRIGINSPPAPPLTAAEDVNGQSTASSPV